MKYGLAITGFFQWPEIFKFREYNWINFELIHIGFEAGNYKGTYFEVTFILLGIGFWAEVFEKRARQEFMEFSEELMNDYAP